MKVLFCLLALLTVGFANGPQTITLDPKAWWVDYGGTGPSTRPIKVIGGGLAFNYRDVSTDVWTTYVTTNHVKPLYGAAYLSMTLQTVTTGSPTYLFNRDGSNTGTIPASFRPYFASGHDLADGERWWAHSIYYDLTAGGYVTLTIPLSPTGCQWSGVNGECADQDATTLANFTNSLQHTNLIGGTNGGGFAYGHGLTVTGGTSQMQILSFSAF